MENLGYYVGVILVLIIGFVVIKKITSCLFRLVVGIVMLGALGWAAHLMDLF